MERRPAPRAGPVAPQGRQATAPCCRHRRRPLRRGARLRAHVGEGEGLVHGRLAALRVVEGRWAAGGARRVRPKFTARAAPSQTPRRPRQQPAAAAAGGRTSAAGHPSHPARLVVGCGGHVAAVVAAAAEVLQLGPEAALDAWVRARADRARSREPGACQQQAVRVHRGARREPRRCARARRPPSTQAQQHLLPALVPRHLPPAEPRSASPASSTNSLLVRLPCRSASCPALTCSSTQRGLRSRVSKEAA